MKAAQAAFARGREALSAGHWVAAENAFARAVALDGAFGLGHLQLAEALARTGGSAQDRRTHLAAALVDLPKNPRAHELFGDALASTDEPEAALLHLRCALELAPSLRAARRRAVRLALRIEGPEAAETLAAPLVKGRTSAQDWLVVSDVAAALEDWRPAALAMRAAASALDSAPLHLRAAALFERAEQPEDAERARAEASALDPRPERELRALPRSRRR